MTLSDDPIFAPYAVFQITDYWHVRDGAGRIVETFNTKKEADRHASALKRQDKALNKSQG